MKKMVCSVCGSSSIRKENGRFVCAECGVEYSLEEARGLLQEVDEATAVVPTAPTVDQAAAGGDQLLKLKYDLLCWHQFYEKCHEVEDSFYIVDEYRDTAGDITERKLSWDYKGYFQKVFDDVVFAEFQSEHPELKKEYEQYRKDKQTRRERILAAYEESTRKTSVKAGCIAALVFFVIFFILASAGGSGSTWIVIFFVTSLFIGFCVGKSTETLLESKAPQGDYQLYSYKEYLEEQKKTPEYRMFYDAIFRKYEELAIRDAESVVNRVPGLKQIKEQLFVNCPIPRSYSDEEHVNALLALVIDGRADTLKEAINMYETDRYRNAVTSSLASMNDNILLLNGQIQSIAKNVTSMNGKLGTMVAQNEAIAQSLAEMQIETRILAFDALLS